MNIYETQRWRKIRELVLRRDGYLCQISKRYGKRINANTVHHIFPVEEYPQYKWQTWNMISVCGAAHNSLHDRTTNALTDEGKRLLERTARRLGIAPPVESRK